ncbi:MAG: carbohydrate-binding family 9-like protein [Rikenellaceae bacterium]
MKKVIFMSVVALMSLCVVAQESQPRSYVAPFVKSGEIVVDGDITDQAWAAAPWTAEFVDIRGFDYEPTPIYSTRAKVMWDDTYIYFAFEMEEPHLWGTLTERDATIYWDNDIEIFIDPDSDGRNYQEYEYNVLGTEWDLLLTEPQARGGVHINNFDMKGMVSAVKAYGTINDPSDVDEKWTFEVKMPIKGVLQSSYDKHKPMSEQRWRLNFSRVEWLKFEVVDGEYRKKEGTNNYGFEENWVWTPTGAVDMHRPEKWGYLTFEK